MKNFLSNALVALTLLPLMHSCGKAGSGPSSNLSPAGDHPTTPRTRDEQEIALDEIGSIDGSTIQGTYKAVYTTLNPQVNGTIAGSVVLKREGDSFRAFLRLFAGKPATWHQQGVYMGTRCPTLQDDKNNDGYIDIIEALAVVGAEIMPLDSSIASQAAGKNFYPLSDLSGSYDYERETSFSRMFADFKDVDRDTTDLVGKLGPDEKFTFLGKVVMVQGVSEDTVLPDTVGTMSRRKPFQNLPIVCGVIAKDDGTPGAVYTGEISGPVAEVQDGQDHPAPADENSIPSTTAGTQGGTTGSNDTHPEGPVGNEGGTSGGDTTTGSTAGGSTSGGSSTAGTSTPGTSVPGRTTTGGSTGGDSSRTSGGFIGGFIGGSSGGHSNDGRTSGGFIGGFIGGSSGGNTH